MLRLVTTDGTGPDRGHDRPRPGPVVDGFVLGMLAGVGVNGDALERAIAAHAVRGDRRAPVPLDLPSGWALHGGVAASGTFAVDRLEMGDVVWFARGRAGTPHVAIRRLHPDRTDERVVGTPLGPLLGTTADGPTIRSAVRAPGGWLYVDVDPVPAAPNASPS